jgi:Rrf2 family iron-sulfur cluster assembly transcriptional regulator
MTHDLWTTLNSRIREYLDSVTLQSMMDEQLAKGIEIESRPMLRKAISSSPVVKPVKTNAPNSIFALGSMLNK